MLSELRVRLKEPWVQGLFEFVVVVAVVVDQYTWLYTADTLWRAAKLYSQPWQRIPDSSAKALQRDQSGLDYYRFRLTMLH